MRDHNDITLSGHLEDIPVTFETQTHPGCRFTLIVRDEWKDPKKGPQERFDEVPIVAYGPVRSRAMSLTANAHVIITARLRSNSAGHIHLEAKTIQHLSEVPQTK
jgi:hypothetical protein